MKKQNANLRHAFAANPTRFLAAVARLPVEAQLSQRVQLAAQTTGKQSQISDQLRRLGLQGMARALSQLAPNSRKNGASFARFLTLLVESEIADQKEQRIARRLRSAKLRYQASMADLDYNVVRGFDDALFHWLATGQWIVDRENVVIEGPTGIGKTWLASALGDQACHDDHTVRYARVPELVADLKAARGTDRHLRRMRALHNTELLILDDWGVEPFGREERREVLEILEYRYGRGSTLIATQVAAEHWSQIIGEPTTTAMILDRILHNAHRLRLKGESLRNRQRNPVSTALVPRDEPPAVSSARVHRL